MFAFGFWRMLYEGKEVSCYSYFANLFFKLWLIVECFQAFFFFCSCIEMIGLLFYLLNFFFNNFIDLYLAVPGLCRYAGSHWLQWVGPTLCIMQASRSSGFPASAHRLQGMRGSAAEARGLSSCISWALEHRRSIGVHGLCCSPAYGILLGQRSNSYLLHL